MGRVNTPLLDEMAASALKQGIKEGQTHAFRTRCHVILLKATGRTSAEVGTITSMTEVSVNAWVKRYKTFAISGLYTRPGRGRKAKLCPEADGEAVLRVVKAHRQRLQTAQAAWAQESGKSVGSTTLKAFFKVLVVDISA